MKELDEKELVLLDRFAGLALNGLLSNTQGEVKMSTMAEKSYSMAKEMIKERRFINGETVKLSED